jgi:hypothetical protein
MILPSKNGNIILSFRDKTKIFFHHVAINMLIDVMFFVYYIYVYFKNIIACVRVPSHIICTI